MVIVVTGANDFLRRRELKKLVDAFVAEHTEFGLERIDAGEVEVGRLLESVASLPFLAQRRMIILTEIGTNKTITEHVSELLDAVSDTTDLIIEEQKFDKRLSLYKTLKKRTDFREFAELDERGLATWLQQEAKDRRGELKANDANYLVSRAGTNQMSLSNELDKLLTYDSRITKETIDLLVEPMPTSSMFDLLDAAFSGDKKRVIALYEDQRRQQVEPQAIMGMFAWQIHIIAVVALNATKGVDEIARSAKLNPFVVRKTLNLTKKLATKEVKDLVERALALDVRLKSEAIDADDAVQHFLISI